MQFVHQTGTIKPQTVCVMQQQFIDEVLSTGLLLYVSRDWLSAVFHLVISQDLFASFSTVDAQVLTTLLSGSSLVGSCSLRVKLM